MKLLYSLLLVVTIILTLSPIKTELINYNGKSYYLNGPDIAWDNFGWDFGISSWGNGYDSEWWEGTFTQIQNSGGNAARIWIHCQGTENPLFDDDGNCIGLNPFFFNDMDDMINRAKNHNIIIIFSLWTFYSAVAGHQDLITDVNKTQSYIDNALIPMLKRYSNQCNLLAWEVMNEPEWIMKVPEGGSYADIDPTIVQRFVGMIAEAVHQHSAKMVTVGSASLKWSSDQSPAYGNYWKDSAIQAAYNSHLAYLDFYQVHYYDWMAEKGNDYSPYNRPLSYWNLDKPVLVGESGNTGFFSYQEQYDNGYLNGYAGVMIWAYKSGGAANWTQFNTQMKNFRDAHIDNVDFTGCDSPSTFSSFSSFLKRLVSSLLE